MVNQFVCAVPLGRTQDYEGVRLYTGLGQLVATILVEKNLVATAETYTLACKDAVPDVKSLIPSHNVSLSTASAAPTSCYRSPHVPELQLAYISSSLELGSDCPVMVSGIQNGVNKFSVRKLSPDVERTRIQLNLSLKQVEVYQLS